jgi:hypothetical protein
MEYQQRVTRARSVRAFGTVVLVATSMQACMTWGASVQPVAEVLEQKPGSALKVVRADLSTHELRDAWISGDTLRGRRMPGNTDFAVPLTDIRSVEVRRLSATRTLLLIAGLGVTAAIVAEAVSDDPPPQRTEPPTTSCPLVYAWDGTDWRLDSGTFGGAIVRALQRTDVDNLNFVRPVDGMLRLKVANELSETDYLDGLHVLAIDHEPGVTLAPDGDGGIHTIGELQPAVSAADFAGREALARVAQADGWNWESVPTGRNPSRAADVRDGLEVAFVRPAGAHSAHLVLDGNNTAWAAYMLHQFVEAHGSATAAWYDSLNAQPMHAIAMQERLAREAFLSVSLNTRAGWTKPGLFWEAGPEIVKRQVMHLDLSEVAGDTVRIRLESVPSFWMIDRVSIDFEADRPFTVTRLDAISARDHRGQDVGGLIVAVDDRYHVLETGDSAELHFRVPPVPQGSARSYLLSSTGWYRVHTSMAAAPDAATLRRVVEEPLGISRESVERLNRTLAAMQTASR